MHELSHRSKNLLAVIQSISRRTARTTTTIEEFESRFGRRLQGLAASHDVLVRNSWQGAPLADLMRQQLTPFMDIQSSRIERTGPDIVVTAEAAQAIGLAIHELATNAIKYGALSVPAGKVKISWAFDSELLGIARIVVEMGRARWSARSPTVPQWFWPPRGLRNDYVCEMRRSVVERTPIWLGTPRPNGEKLGASALIRVNPRRKVFAPK